MYSTRGGSNQADIAIFGLIIEERVWLAQDRCCYCIMCSNVSITKPKITNIGFNTLKFVWFSCGVSIFTIMIYVYIESALKVGDKSLIKANVSLQVFYMFLLLY